VLLVEDSYGQWTWAKGHIEEGESPEQAAVREVSEETGLVDLQIVEKLGKQEYYFTLSGKNIFKTVHIFLIKASAGEELNIQVSEIQDAGWFSPEEAVEKIEYDGSRSLLEKGIVVFREKCG
jgi:8-oxo-dGTP diphosphatase